MTLAELLKLYEISKAEYEKNGWGNAINKIKYPTSYVERWTENDVFDEDGAFNELAIIAITYMRRNYPILKYIGRYWEFMEADRKQKVQGVVFKIMNDLILNRNLWERKNISQKSFPGWSASDDTTGWIIPMDEIGFDAEAIAYDAGLHSLEVVETGDGTSDSIIGVFGKIDFSKQYIEKVCIDNGTTQAQATAIAETLLKGDN